MPSSGSICASCCSSPSCSPPSNPTCISSRCWSSSTSCCPTRPVPRPAGRRQRARRDRTQHSATALSTAVDGALAERPQPPTAAQATSTGLRTMHANLSTTNRSTARSCPSGSSVTAAPASLAKDVIVAIDQIGSMADSIVYASLFGSVLAQLPSLRTHLVAFDTAVTDLTPMLHDPVDVLFGVQLGGGTDIAAGGRVLPTARQPSQRHRADPDLRSVRGRQPRPAARRVLEPPAPGSRCCVCWRSATRACPCTTG